ncbi:MAG: DUF4872 domain-containing protein [Halobacteriota archaeon]
MPSEARSEAVNWIQYSLDDTVPRMNLFSLYVFIEIGGTGWGCFRYLYARFLNEAAAVTGSSELGEIEPFKLRH